MSDRLAQLQAHMRECQRAANEADASRRALRAIVQPILDEMTDYHRIGWRRQWGAVSPHWGDWKEPQEHPAHRMSLAQIAAHCDAIRAPYREELAEYDAVKKRLQALENQIKATHAAIDDLNKVPLKSARKAPKDSRGKTVALDLFNNKEGDE